MQYVSGPGEAFGQWEGLLSRVYSLAPFVKRKGQWITRKAQNLEHIDVPVGLVDQICIIVRFEHLLKFPIHQKQDWGYKKIFKFDLSFKQHKCSTANRLVCTTRQQPTFQSEGSTKVALLCKSSTYRCIRNNVEHIQHGSSVGLLVCRLVHLVTKLHSSAYNITGRRLFLRLIPEVVQIINTSFVVALPLPPKLQQIRNSNISPQKKTRKKPD